MSDEAPWQPSQRYPDPSIQVLDQSFARYRLNLSKVERIAQSSQVAAFDSTIITSL